MVDIHIHILPGVDDGAADVDEAVFMAELSLAGGVNILAATAHSSQSKGYFNKLRERFRQFQNVLKQENLPITLVPGMEILASDNLPDQPHHEKVLSLNGSRYYLIEFYFDEHPSYMKDALRRMHTDGKIPVVAHPERYEAVMDNPNLAYEFRTMGCLLQMNKGSLFGAYGRQEAKTAEQLLDHGLINCIASDAHNTSRRPPGFHEVRQYLEEQYTEDQADLLLNINPRRIVRNEQIVDEGCEPIQGSRWF